jgi:RsiW-degrading membrane proteinase PrsW (M82 family)
VTAAGGSASCALRLVATCLGAAATLPVLAGGELIGALALVATQLHAGVAAAFVNAAIPEETAKLVALALLLRAARSSRLGLQAAETGRLVAVALLARAAPTPPVASRADDGHGGVRCGLQAGFALGLGFALVEALLQVARLAGSLDVELTLTVTTIRAVTALPLHACVGALAGCYLTTRSYAKAWVVPTALHGLYDLAVFEAARGGGFGTLVLGYAVLALVVWWVATFYAWSATPGGAAPAAPRLSPL